MAYSARREAEERMRRNAAAPVNQFTRALKFVNASEMSGFIHELERALARAGYWMRIEPIEDDGQAEE